MHEHSVFGPVVAEMGWVPSPSYVLRRHRVLDALRGAPPGRMLEIGCGAGALANELARRGFVVHACDNSHRAREVARHLNANTSNVTVLDRVPKHAEVGYDYIVALEVLEHIADDQAALQNWCSLMAPAGQLLISVPGHPERWNASDVWAGHVRRYERNELHTLLEQSGFEVERIESYGAPLANVIEPVRAWHHARLLRARRTQDQAARSARSGVERSLETRLFAIQAGWLGTRLMKFFCTLQACFAATDIGTAYLAMARKRYAP